MTGLEWILIVTLGVLYFALIFTVAVVTFRNGHIALGLLGIVFPVLWLVGAVLPPRSRSAYDGDSYQRDQAVASTARGGAL
jgi:hypothetical protein